MIAVLAAVALALTPGATESFESMTSLPADWKVNEYTAGLSKVSVRRGHAADGKQFVRLSAKQPNHTRLMIPVAVTADTTYRFSAMVRATAPQDVPALLAVDGADGVTTGPIPGDGQWQERDLYLRTGKATSVTLELSLGWFGQTVAGRADFDVLKLEKVDTVPAGTPVAGGVTPAVISQGPGKAWLPLTALLVLLVAGCGGVLLRGDRVG